MLYDLENFREIYNIIKKCFTLSLKDKVNLVPISIKSKFSFAYTAKIIESWHKNGFKTPDDIQKQKKNDDNDGFAAYDIDLFEKMLNTKD